jgi:hypothetical protein
MGFILLVTQFMLTDLNTQYTHVSSRFVLSGTFNIYHAKLLTTQSGFCWSLLAWPSYWSFKTSISSCMVAITFCATKINIITYESSSRTASYCCAKSSSIPNKSCAYGPAHAQPPRACIPNTSFRTVHTKLWCRKVPRGWRTINEKMGSLFTDIELGPRRISSGMVRMCARTILGNTTTVKTCDVLMAWISILWSSTAWGHTGWYIGTNIISGYKIKKWGSSEMVVSKTKSEVKGKWWADCKIYCSHIISIPQEGCTHNKINNRFPHFSPSWFVHKICAFTWIFSPHVPWQLAPLWSLWAALQGQLELTPLRLQSHPLLEALCPGGNGGCPVSRRTLFHLHSHLVWHS